MAVGPYQMDQILRMKTNFAATLQEVRVSNSHYQIDLFRDIDILVARRVAKSANKHDSYTLMCDEVENLFC